MLYCLVMVVVEKDVSELLGGGANLDHLCNNFYNT
jgi:hypothetical protein